VLSGTWEIGVRDRHYHLCIAAVTGASPMAELARHPALRAISPPCCTWSSPAPAAAAVWVPAPGA